MCDMIHLALRSHECDATLSVHSDICDVMQCTLDVCDMTYSERIHMCYVARSVHSNTCDVIHCVHSDARGVIHCAHSNAYDVIHCVHRNACGVTCVADQSHHTYYCAPSNKAHIPLFSAQ